LAKTFYLTPAGVQAGSKTQSGFSIFPICILTDRQVRETMLTVAIHKDESTQEAVRRAALELFAAKGYEGTSLREIAEAVDMTKAAIYYHFPSKEAVLLAIAAPVLGDTDAVLRRAESGDWMPEDVLRGLLEVMIKHHEVVAALASDIGAQARLSAQGASDGQEERLIALLMGESATLAKQAGAVGAVGVLRSGLSAFSHRLEDAKEHILDSALGALRGRA
jgi:AcrR family transcriptional regulator